MKHVFKFAMFVGFLAVIAAFAVAIGHFLP